MGARCYNCGEKFGRCYEHAGNCPDDCTFGKHACIGPDESGWDY